MIDALPEKEKEEDAVYYTKIVGRNYLKRGAALAWLSQFDAAVNDIRRAMDFKGLYTEEEREIMQQDIDSIKIRQESQDIKLQGDIFFARNLLNESLEQYLKALEMDPMNEYALSNIGVIYLKR
jgi:tetratricopeptide (TPR) repeat protein